MDTPTLALLLSVLSLLFSIYTIVMSRRTTQLYKLAGVRTKLFSLKLKVSLYLVEIRKFNEACAKIDTESISVNKIEKHFEFLTKLEGALEQSFSKYSRFPLSFPMGLVEETEHQIDCMVIQHDLWEKEFYPCINLLIEKVSKCGCKQAEDGLCNAIPIENRRG